jgi:hypothetical protein
MLDIIKKWWFRKWSDWTIDKEYLKYPAINMGKTIILRRTSNDGLIQLKTIKEK